MRVVRRAVVRVGTRVGMGALPRPVSKAVRRPVIRCGLAVVMRVVLGEDTRAVNKAIMTVVLGYAMHAAMRAVIRAAIEAARRTFRMWCILVSAQLGCCLARAVCHKDRQLLKGRERCIFSGRCGEAHVDIATQETAICGEPHII